MYLAEEGTVGCRRLVRKRHSCRNQVASRIRPGSQGDRSVCRPLDGSVLLVDCKAAACSIKGTRNPNYVAGVEKKCTQHHQQSNIHKL